MLRPRDSPRRRLQFPCLQRAPGHLGPIRIFRGDRPDYVGIEDTGKTWPSLDLKLGSLVVSSDLHEPLQSVTDDLLLNVSPFIFALLARYIDADTDTNWVCVSEANRAALIEVLEGTQVEMMPSPCPIGVAWVRLPKDWSSSELCDWLADEGISVLPGSPFFWHAPEAGQRFVRIALMRPLTEFRSAVAAFADAVSRYAPRQVGEDHMALVLRVAAEVLECEVTGTDDFFTLGGDSMSAMYLIGRLGQETGLPLPVRMIFEDPRIGALASRIAERNAQDANESPPQADPFDLRAKFGSLVDAAARRRG